MSAGTVPCPECGARNGVRTVDSRGTAGGLVRRRKMCPCGHRYTTFEALAMDRGERAVLKAQLLEAFERSYSR